MNPCNLRLTLLIEAYDERHNINQRNIIFSGSILSLNPSPYTGSPRNECSVHNAEVHAIKSGAD